MRFMMPMYPGRKAKTGIDGPFSEAQELIGGYWLIQVRSYSAAAASCAAVQRWSTPTL